MKILFIHCRYKLPGGEDGVVAAELELLRSSGMEVELLSFSNDANTILKILQLPFNLGSYFKTIRRLRTFRPDIVHIHNLHFAASTSVLYALKRSGVPFLITLHNFRLLCPSGTLYFNGSPYLKSVNSSFPWSAVADGVYVHSKILTFWVGFSTWINRKLGTYNLANRYIVLTGHAKAVIKNSSLKLDQNKIIIKPNFVYDPGTRQVVREKNFLYIGRLSEEKGIQVLLEAFQQTDYPLTIIGEGPLKGLVEAAMQKNPRITYLGYQQKEVIINEISRCNALVFPSVWYETFGLTIIEAFSASTPVIASNIGSPSLLIKDKYNGLHFKEASPEDLRSKLKCWEGFTEAEKNQYRTNARKSYELYYTPGENLKQLVSIYTSLIAEKKDN